MDHKTSDQKGLSNVVKILFNAGRTILSVALSKLDPNVPPGLEYLVQLDQLIVKQQVELLEVFTGFETANKYQIVNSMNQPCYFALEESDCCTRNCCGNLRSFEMKIVDNQGTECIRINRPFRCDNCCWPCCLQTMEVFSNGALMGSIEQKWHPFLPKFEIKDSEGNAVLTMNGPFCSLSCCKDINYPIMSIEGEEIGKVTKEFSGVAREMFTDADNFAVLFPMDLDVRLKATLLGAVFMIDFMFFEHKNNDSQGNTVLN